MGQHMEKYGERHGTILYDAQQNNEVCFVNASRKSDHFTPIKIARQNASAGVSLCVVVISADLLCSSEGVR
jgi:hypothetical protein